MAVKNITPESIVNLLIWKWELKIYGKQRDKQIEIARDLLKKYDPELVYYTVKNSHLYVNEGQNIYSLNFIPFIIDKAKEDYEKVAFLPQKVSMAKKRKEVVLSRLGCSHKPVDIQIEEKKIELIPPTENDIDRLFDI